MASNYTGLPFNTPIDGLRQPLPGQPAVLSLPADIDPNNVATMFTAQYKDIANQLAYIHSAARLRPAVGHFSNTQKGWGALSQIGIGTGTVVYTTGNNVNHVVSSQNAFFVISIVAGGIPGVGTYKVSADGGETYGAITTIPAAASTLEPTIGAPLTWSATFTTGDYYYFFPGDTPIHRWYGRSQINAATPETRLAVDHLGILQRRYATLEENWFNALTSAVGASFGPALMPGNSKWNLATGLLGSVTIATIGTGLDRQLVVNLNTGDAPGRFARLSMSTSPFNLGGAPQMAVAEWMAIGGGTNVADVFMGFSDNASLAVANSYIGFRRLAADTTINAVFRHNGGAVIAVPLSRFLQGVEANYRIEVLETNANGNVARFFIGGALSHEIALTGLTFAAGTEGFVCDVSQSGLGAGVLLRIGRVRLAYSASDQSNSWI